MALVPAPPGSGLVPADHLLPDVLPTEHLDERGRPTGELRERLRRVSSWRNVMTVVYVYLLSFGVIAAAVVISHPFAWVVAFVLMGPAFARFAILAHEAAHRMLFSNRRWNDAVGRWLLAYPAFVEIDGYRRGHMAHHRDELGPDEPDLALYAGYPRTSASVRRKLLRDISGRTGVKLMAGLFRALRRPDRRRRALGIIATQAVILGVFWATGRPELYPLLWLAPYLTVWRLLNRLRAVAEHGGMTRSADRRCTTHHIRQSLLARFFLVPFNTGWHLAHHVDPGIPWRQLPELHRELEAAGWVTPDLTHAGYLAFWRRAASG